MSRRPASALLLVSLVVQFLVPAVPVVVARTTPEASVGQEARILRTGKSLPSIGERLGVANAPTAEPVFDPIDPADEPSALAPDGTYTLGRNRAVSAEPSGRATVATPPYGAVRRDAHGPKKDGDVSLLRTDVSGQITTNTTWDLAGSPWVVTANTEVVSPAVLTIEPGVVVKLADNVDLLARKGATISAVGTAEAPITITSLTDDAVGGDTNEDGAATTPARSDWGAFGSEGELLGSTIYAAYGTYQHVHIRYGDSFRGRFALLTMNDVTSEDMYHGLFLEKNPSTTRVFERLTLRDNYVHLYLYSVPSAITIKDSVLTGADSWAVSASNSTAIRLTGNRIDFNDTGTNYAIAATSSPMVLRYNSIAWNGEPEDGFVFGLSSTGSTVDAQYNWWGSTTGPEVLNQAATGGGSRITTSVTYTNWLGKAYEAEHKKGSMPWAAKAGIGVDVATGNLTYRETDIQIPTIGFPLEITRAYNSASYLTSGVFGSGWTWNYGVALDVTSDAYGVVLTDAGGAKHYFKRNPDGTFSGEYGIFSQLTYDAGAQEYTLLHTNQDREVFDSTGKLLRQVDPDGNTTTFTRDASGQVVTVTEPTGRTLTLTYTSGRIATITDPVGRVYRYTNAGLLTKVEKEQPAGTVFATCTYTYTSSLLTKVTGCDGDTLEQTYNATSKKVETQKLNGASVRFAYGPVTDTISGFVFPQYASGVWDTFGKLHVYYFTKSNAVYEHHREKSQDAGGGYSWYIEDQWTYRTFVEASHTDIMQRQVSTDRDWRRGNVLARTDHALDRTTTFTYDAFNNLLTTTDPLGRLTTHTYDSEQHLVTTTDALDHTTTTTYTSAGLVATVTDANDAVSSFTYDAYGNPASVTTATDETVTFGYDAAGRKLWEETPDAKRTTFTFNGRDQVLTVTDPLEGVTTTTYDAKGRKATVTDADSFTTTFAYNDAKNALATTTDALEGVVTYTYNPNNTLQKVSDALAHETAFTYDAFGRQTSLTDPLGRTSTTEYRADGTAESTTDARGNETTFTYDSGGQLTSSTDADDAGVTYAYDDVGNRTSMVDSDGTLTVTYDALNRPLTRSRVSVAGTEAITYTYDAVGNLATLTYPNGFAVTYAHDDARRLATVTDSDARVTTYDYDANGRLHTVALPNGTSATYAYDDAGRITGLTHAAGGTAFATIAHTYDGRGNRLTRTVDGASEAYAYDPLARLSSVTYPGAETVGYTYDATGNRTAHSDALGTVASTIDAADQLVRVEGEGLRQYDLDGHLKQVGVTRAFTWNTRGQLVGVAAPTNLAPTAHAGDDASGYVDWLMFLDGSLSSDPEGLALTYTWTEVAGNPASNVLRGMHAPRPALVAPTAGTYQFDLVVSDGVETSTADRVVVTIAAGTPPPIVQTTVPASGMSGYVRSANPTTRYFTADYLMTGLASSITYLGAAQFPLPEPPAQATLTGATLTLTGYSASGNTATDQWSVDLLPTALDEGWAATTYTAIAGATPDRTLTPVLVGTGQVALNQPNTWTFTAEDVAVLASRVAGSQALSLRTIGATLGASSRVNWFSGKTSVVAKKPTLTLAYTPDPLPDQEPYADAGRWQTVAGLGPVTLDGSASFDAEGAVTVAWAAHAGNPAAVTISDASAVSPSVTFTEPGTYRFDLSVTDSAEQTATASTRVTVGAPTGVTTAAFTYDGDGDRVTATVGGQSTRFVVDPLPEHARVLAERVLPSGAWTYHVYGHDLLYSVTGPSITVLHSDPLGSTVATTDGSGAATARMTYDVFGEQRDADTSPTAYTFTGERMDPTGLQYLRARYYDPTVGRFLSRDPFPAQAADTQTFNRYVYVKNNPTNYVDPSGEIAQAAALFLLPAMPSLVDLASRAGPKLGLALAAIVGTAATARLATESHVSEFADVRQITSTSGGASAGSNARGSQRGQTPRPPVDPGSIAIRVGPLAHALQDKRGHDFIRELGVRGEQLAGRLVQPLRSLLQRLDPAELPAVGKGRTYGPSFNFFTYNGYPMSVSVFRQSQNSFVITDFWYVYK